VTPKHVALGLLPPRGGSSTPLFRRDSTRSFTATSRQSTTRTVRSGAARRGPAKTREPAGSGGPKVDGSRDSEARRLRRHRSGSPLDRLVRRGLDQLGDRGLEPGAGRPVSRVASSWWRESAASIDQSSSRWPAVHPQWRVRALPGGSRGVWATSVPAKADGPRDSEARRPPFLPRQKNCLCRN
jgi:hypothetical protein